MADRKTRRGPRGSKADIDAVKKQGRRTGRQVKAENKESLIGLAEALGDINEGESAAHLEMRMDALEAQVEKLLARREGTERGVQGEIEVMRARIEDAMEAVGSTSEEMRATAVESEKRLMGLINRVEERSADATQSLSEEIADEVTGAVAKVEKTESRLKGQTKALEDSVEERLRSLSEVAVTEREAFEAAAAETLERTEELASKAAEAQAASEAKGTEILAEANEAIEGSRREMIEKLDASSAKVEQRLEEHSEGFQASVERRLEALKDSIEERLASLMEETKGATEAVEVSFGEKLTEHMGATDSALEEAESSLTDKFEQERASVEERLVEQKREVDARMGEAAADVRLESQRVKESLEGEMAAVGGSVEALARDLTTRITAVQDGADASASRLEGVMDRIQREAAQERAHLEEDFKEITNEISGLKLKVDEIVGRLSSSEARRATERGGVSATIEGLSERIETLEERVRAAVDEVSAKHAARMEVLSGKIEQLSAADSDAEERSGAVEYLSRRVGETAQRLDEVMIKVNAIGRHVTKPTKAELPEDIVEAASAVDERLDRLEESVEAFAAKPGEPDLFDVISRLETLERATTKAAIAGQVPSGLADRLDSIEKKVVALVTHARQNTLPDNLVSRLEVLERAFRSASTTLVSRQEEIDERVEELERSAPSGAPAQNILPNRRRRR